MLRGVRGATTVDADEPAAVVDATRELLEALVAANDLQPDRVACAWFTTTLDVRSEFPAVAARQLGWIDVPLLCGHEMDVPFANPRSIARCIRALILVNTDRAQDEVEHVYLRGARTIRDELDRARAGQLPQPAAVSNGPRPSGAA